MLQEEQIHMKAVVHEHVFWQMMYVEFEVEQETSTKSQGTMPI